MREVNFNQYAKEFLNQLPKGAFLTTKVNNEINTMTIGWGFVGVMWSKPTLIVAVRYSRKTFEMMQNTNQFSVSVPLSEDMKNELMICGTKSGRDIDKFKECNINPIPSKVINTPVIAECDLHFECKIVYKQVMDPGLIKEQFIKDKYSTHDYHVLYYGEIVSCYVKE